MFLTDNWRLYYYPGDPSIDSPERLRAAGVPCVDARVPGNVELDLSAAGVLPADLFMGENITLAEKYETYDWCYETEFTAPEEYRGRRVLLRFGGVDCFAAYFLNGQCVYSSANALIEHEFDVSRALNYGGVNTLHVMIGSPVVRAYSRGYDLYTFDMNWSVSRRGLYGARKPPHCYGWDIMPRAVSAGIWRDVELVCMDEIEFGQLFFYTAEAREGFAELRCCYELDFPATPEYISAELTVQLEGRCGGSTFSASGRAYFKAGYISIYVSNPKLWYPRGYGEATLYEVEAKVLADGVEVTSKRLRVGIRTVELHRDGGDFRFRVNGTDVMCRGTNWVPLDAYHSRDAARYDRALELVRDANCNIVRCWGGNVYEDHRFFDLCDESGIMVWQDFAMACSLYPQDAEFLEQIRREAASVVRKLRNHPSIILWSGDNECDEIACFRNTLPSDNKITREVLPEVIKNNDHGRPYLPSSPFVSDEIGKSRSLSRLPEDHLWGSRDYFKSDYYKNSKARFVSETGYHGCPPRESIERFIEPDHVWPCTDNPQWNLHSSDQQNSPARVELMAKQIAQLFGEIPDDLDGFALASQISQAEAKKFFIENVRRQKPVRTGVIWWNMLDGWPQMSDAVVDYYFNKKLAYYYIKNSQQPVCLMCGEIADWYLPVYAVNDTLRAVSGTYAVTDGETGAVLAEGGFSVGVNGAERVAGIPIMYSEHRLLLLKWTADGAEGFNHYVCGMPPLSLERYKSWVGMITSGRGQ